MATKRLWRKMRSGSADQEPVAQAARDHSAAPAQGKRAGLSGNSGPVARLGAPVQAKLEIGVAVDPLEREADAKADQVISSWGEADRMAPRSVYDTLAASGQPLDPATRAFVQPRFGRDFGSVRVHTDQSAARSAQAIRARAYTSGHDIVFGSGQYAPHTVAGRHLLAHELTHVAQQTQSPGAGLGRPAAPTVQRAVEVRPPGKGEASAFSRRQELIDRMNTFSTAIQYRLDGQRIAYDLIDEAGLMEFDRQMRAFIDRTEVVPLRLITSAGRVQDAGGAFVPLLVDSLVAGYLDLDDTLASSDLSFQMNMVHLLQERFGVRNYARRIGTAISQAEFDRAHAAGLGAETELLRSVIGDPTLKFNYEEQRPNGTIVFAFKSAEGYRVFHVFRRSGREQRGGVLFADSKDGRRLTIDELIAERAAAEAAAAPAAPTTRNPPGPPP